MPAITTCFIGACQACLAAPDPAVECRHPACGLSRLDSPRIPATARVERRPRHYAHSVSAEGSQGWMACTDRLRLRLLRVEDAVPLREIADAGWVEALASRPGDRTLTPWAIVLRGSGAVVGFCGFFARPVKGTTMGYAIVPQFRGQGLATEAAAAVLDWAERHGVDVYASIRPPNPASARVLEKIGMWRVGSYRDGDGRRDIYRRRRAS